MYGPESSPLRPDAADLLIEGVSMFPNIQFDKIDVPTTQFPALTDRVQAIQDELGRPPVTAVFCSQGIYRSRIIASKLHEASLVQLSKFNWRRQDIPGDERGKPWTSSEHEMALGAGLRGYEANSLGIDDDGGIVNTKGETELIDLLIIALSSDVIRTRNLEVLVNLLKYFQARLPETEQTRPAYLVWLNTSEDDLDIWFPELAQKE